jgi:predicted nucleic-acid-binding protein
MLVLDANAVIRYILQDNSEMADIVERALISEACFLPVEVAAEIVYVLIKVYGVERGVVADTLSAFLEMENINVSDGGVLRVGFRMFSETTLDFVDCLLIGYANIHGWRVLTFDKKLKKHLP